jgi:hypothetical protein
VDHQYMLKRFESLSDEELALVLGSQRSSYAPEAVEVARMVAEARGVPIQPDVASSDPEPLLEHHWPYGVGDLFLVPWHWRSPENPPNPRLLKASLIAPFAAVLVMAVAFIIPDLEAVRESDSVGRDVAYGVIFSFMVLAPGAYLAEVVFGWPAYVVLQRTHHLQLPYLIGAGAFTGILFCIGSAVVLPLFFGLFLDDFFFFIAGAAAGGFGGAVFWLTALASPNQL